MKAAELMAYDIYIIITIFIFGLWLWYRKFVRKK